MDYLIVVILGGFVTWLLFYITDNLDYKGESYSVNTTNELLMTRDELIESILSFDEKLLTHRFYKHGWWITSKYLKDNKWNKDLLLKTNPWSLIKLYNELYLVDVKNIKKYENKF